MTKSALRFLIVTAGLLKVVLCTLFGRNIYVPIERTWSEAQQYCREHYTDLSSISSQEEDEELIRIAGDQRQPHVWIGLYKDANIWKWSGGEEALFLNWSNQSNTGQGNKCAAQSKNGWWRMKCKADKFHFYCFSQNIPVLVKENKTWEEAMEQCRQQSFDLVSLPSEPALVQILQISKEAQTDHVWTGLRYLADNWLWVDGETMEYQAWSQGEMPRCPAWSHHCGALSLKGQHWDSWDCADKLNFVCY